MVGGKTESLRLCVSPARHSAPFSLQEGEKKAVSLRRGTAEVGA